MSDSISTHGNNPIIGMFLSVTLVLLSYFGEAINVVSQIEDNTFKHLQYLAVICSILASLFVIVPKVIELIKKLRK